MLQMFLCQKRIQMIYDRSKVSRYGITKLFTYYFNLFFFPSRRWGPDVKRNNIIVNMFYEAFFSLSPPLRLHLFREKCNYLNDCLAVTKFAVIPCPFWATTRAFFTVFVVLNKVKRYPRLSLVCLQFTSKHEKRKKKDLIF